jgi:hypothetical protein
VRAIRSAHTFMDSVKLQPFSTVLIDTLIVGSIFRYVAVRLHFCSILKVSPVSPVYLYFSNVICMKKEISYF